MNAYEFFKTSSKRQHELEISKLKREELEKKHKAEPRIARQRLGIEKQMQLRQLQIQNLNREHRKQVAAAALEEIEKCRRFRHS